MKTEMKFALATATLTLLGTVPTFATTVYIPEGSAGEILVVDADTGSVEARWPGFEAVHGLAGVPGARYIVAGSYSEVAKEEAEAPAKPDGVSQDEHEAHHASRAASVMPKDAGVSILTIVEAETGAVVRRIEVPGAVHHVAMSPDGRYAAVTHPTTDGISIIDLDTLAFKAFVPTGTSPNYAVFARDGRSVFVTNADSGTISEVDVDKTFVKRNILSGEAPEHVVMSHDGKRLYVADAYAGKVHEVIISDGNISRSLDVGGEIHGLNLSDDDGTLFVSGKGDDKIAAIDLSSGKAKFAALAPAPYHLTTIAGTNSLYVSSREEPKVWIVDQENLAVTGEIPVLGEGHEMVVLP